jgi:superfamily II DNA or RNA helicase
MSWVVAGRWLGKDDPTMTHTISSDAAHRGRIPLLTIEQCRQIAGEFDGTTRTIDRLLTEWREVVPGLKRHNIAAAARRGGYATSKERKAWTDAEDQFLRDNWHRLSGDEIAQRLERTFTSVNLRHKRIGIGRYDGHELTIRDLEVLTKLDHRQWHDFIARGWLKARKRRRRCGAAPITYVSITALHVMLREHPEIYDYRGAPKRARALLELDVVPDAPAWKRVVCNSDAWQPGLRQMPVGRTMTHGAPAMAERLQQFRLRSCATIGGTSFWSPLYSLPMCPRCGCQVSRYSPDALFTDMDPGDDEVITIQARKLGLQWAGGQLIDAEGRTVNDRDVLAALFDGTRSAGRSLKAFEKLLDAGLSLASTTAVPEQVLLDNILKLELRPDQEEALQSFVATGAMTAAHAMSFGKSTLGMMAMTRIPGRHLLMVDTQLLRDQWIEKLTDLAPKVEVVRRAKPSMHKVRVFDRTGSLRSAIHIYSYQTRAKLDGPWVVGCFDEVHRLPARRAHRHAFVQTQYRIGLSSTPDMRCDGRGVFVSKMTGAIVGSDWNEQMDGGVVPRIPVKVLLVDDVEHKHEVVGTLLRQHDAVVVLCESIADGEELRMRYGIPFISSRTKDKLKVLRSAKSMILSRVGDAGISVPNCQVTVDHSGLFGSRIQSLQRLGRLMHSQRALYHCILMTHEERYERFAARVEAIKAKGFPVEEVRAERQSASVHRLLSPALQARVSAQENQFLSLLGWRRDELNQTT